MSLTKAFRSILSSNDERTQLSHSIPVLELMLTERDLVTETILTATTRIIVDALDVLCIFDDRLEDEEELLFLCVSEIVRLSLLLNLPSHVQASCEKLLRKIYGNFVRRNDRETIASLMDTTDIKLDLPGLTMYEEKHVTSHVTCDTTVARSIMRKYPGVYVNRPFEHEFFDEIERMVCVEDFDGLNVCDLFASIWSIVKHDDEARMVLLEEMNESVGFCVSGHVSRLINSIRGFVDDEECEVTVSDYHYHKGVLFHRFNQFFDDGIDTCKISDVVNSYEDHGVESETMLRILKDYTLFEWHVNCDGKYEPLRTIIFSSS